MNILAYIASARYFG